MISLQVLTLALFTWFIHFFPFLLGRDQLINQFAHVYQHYSQIAEGVEGSCTEMKTLTFPYNWIPIKRRRNVLIVLVLSICSYCSSVTNLAKLKRLRAVFLAIWCNNNSYFSVRLSLMVSSLRSLLIFVLDWLLPV